MYSIGLTNPLIEAVKLNRKEFWVTFLENNEDATKLTKQKKSKQIDFRTFIANWCRTIKDSFYFRKKSEVINAVWKLFLWLFSYGCTLWLVVFIKDIAYKTTSFPFLLTLCAKTSKKLWSIIIKFNYIDGTSI